MNKTKNHHDLSFIAVTMDQQTTSCVVMAILALSAQTINSALYDISIDSFEPYSGTDSNFMDYGTLRVSKKSRNLFVIDGKFEYFQNMDDDTRCVFQINVGDKSQPIMSGNMGFCEVLKTEGKVMETIRKLSNLPCKDACPFPKGKYFINKYELDESQLPPMVLPGKYTLEVLMVQHDQIKAGYKLRVTIK